MSLHFLTFSHRVPPHRSDRKRHTILLLWCLLRVFMMIDLVELVSAGRAMDECICPFLVIDWMLALPCYLAALLVRWRGSCRTTVRMDVMGMLANRVLPFPSLHQNPAPTERGESKRWIFYADQRDTSYPSFHPTPSKLDRHGTGSIRADLSPCDGAVFGTEI